MKFNALCVLASILATSAQAGVIYVNHGARGEGDGSTWQDAFPELQNALAVAEEGDKLWIAQGVYVPTAKRDRSVAFVIERGIALYGGFSGSEWDESQRDPERNPTLLSGNIGDHDMREDNSYHVLECLPAASMIILDGLKITGAFNDRENNYGAGVSLISTTAAFVNCRVTDNEGRVGGGIYALDSFATFTNCNFVRNNGIGCLLNNSVIQLADCLFRRNSSNRGGALHIYNGADATVVRCDFIGNRSHTDGGAVYTYGNPYFESCYFARNKALSFGGSYGGAILLLTGSATITNCTVVNNWSNFNSGGITTFSPESQPVIRNCIVWGNRSVNGDRHGWVEENQVLLHAGSMKQCLVEGFTGRYGGRSNFDGDPMFVDVEGRNFRVRAGSPCVDRGKDEAVSETTDLDGNPRILSGRVDLGAYESVCEDIRDFDVEARESDSGGYDVTAALKTRLPAGSTVRVAFTPYDEGGHAGEPRVRRARIASDGQGKASLSDCPAGRVSVCVEGCGEGSCREIQCP